MDEIRYVCECRYDTDHDVASNEEYESLLKLATGLGWSNSILNKDCPQEPYSSFLASDIISETEHMFLVRR